MNIKKLGHCCLYIETSGLRILTDPGSFTTAQNTLTGIDIVLITHEHSDHLHVESLLEVLQNNPDAKVITNASVGKILETHNIQYEILEGSAQKEIAGVQFVAYDSKHEEIFEEIGQVQNTGYMIDSKLFYPGDSFSNPQVSVEVLALPVAGPWCKVSDVVRYALSMHPKRAFPVHDGQTIKDRIGSSHKVPEKVLAEHGIEFVSMSEGDSAEF
jgi:L-ascorbate metabolism protein UlaG (beta-lactamase superfamily)